MHDRVLRWALIPAFCTGLASLVVSNLQSAEGVAWDLRVAFGLVTAATISLALILGARARAGCPEVELYQYTRFVSRWVYIAMYLLAIARAILYQLESQHADALHRIHHPAAPLHPLDDFQFYVACCVIPLWVVRGIVLAMPFKERR
jgi:hypothetical protein